ncbi:hypothetical protein Ciccas_014598 [Cichlidogyrus casuarinus]|uniref:Uncharacterized protein n=1 Tax=Cichlidogyrus casuarinus TaxID=1844966 RepID=A0ABD2PMG4_9PLAT
MAEEVTTLYGDESAQQLAKSIDHFSTCSHERSQEWSSKRIDWQIMFLTILELLLLSYVLEIIFGDAPTAIDSFRYNGVAKLTNQVALK